MPSLCDFITKLDNMFHESESNPIDICEINAPTGVFFNGEPC